MHHIAILKKSLGLLQKILSGEKTIESRWYKTRRSPWGTIHSGDTIFFKNSGEAVTIQARVKEVMQFEGLGSEKVKRILEDYAEPIGVTMDYYKSIKDKNYCILIFLKDVKEIQPFTINKKGFGAMAAWITVDDIDKIRN